MNDLAATTINTEIPLLVVGFDFRTASSTLREKLVTTSEDREYIFQSIKRHDPSAGFLVLETCNRIEWIISTTMGQWISQVLSAWMLNRWQQSFPELEDFPVPYEFIGKDAVFHVLRVVVGLESLATGEAQIAGQFQNNLKRAQKEKTSSPVINRLSHVAGRIARSGYKIGFRSNYRKGIHGLVTKYMHHHFGEDMSDKTILVAGMGSIGRRTAALLAESCKCRVIRFNRTVREENEGNWFPMEQLSKGINEADALVVATGGIVPVIGTEAVEPDKLSDTLLIMDIGIPRQVRKAVRDHENIDYRNIDDLRSITEGTGKQDCIAPLEVEIQKEFRNFVQFCRGREMSVMLTGIHKGRLELTEKRIPQLMQSHFSDLEDNLRNDIENTMKQLIRDYSNDLFTAFHDSMEHYWSHHNGE